MIPSKAQGLNYGGRTKGLQGLTGTGDHYYSGEGESSAHPVYRPSMPVPNEVSQQDMYYGSQAYEGITNRGDQSWTKHRYGSAPPMHNCRFLLHMLIN
jgi:hypothetical protein